MMADWLPNYEYEGDKVSALFEGQVIASGDSFAVVSATAEEYLEGLRKERKAQKREAKRKVATHIVTPNGLRGEILSRVEGIFGDEITVRFANGQIRKLETAAGDGVKFKVKEASAPTSRREALAATLDEQYSPNREGLIARADELEEVRREAGNLIAVESSLAEQQGLHQIALAAEAELAEIRDVLAHLDAVDAENAVPAAPQYTAAAQASFGHGASDNWLEVTAQQMIAESEAEDFDKLLAEGPVLLVAGLDDGAVAHAGTVREIALAHVAAKTAGFQGEAVESYREQFVAAAEAARRQELKGRQATARTAAKVEAKVLTDVPDEALFS